MKIYIDINNGYKCYYNNNEDETLFEYESEFFKDGTAPAVIEGYRCIPVGYIWRREDGKIFEGEMHSPIISEAELKTAQLEYDVEQYKLALTEIEAVLGVNYK